MAGKECLIGGFGQIGNMSGFNVPSKLAKVTYQGGDVGIGTRSRCSLLELLPVGDGQARRADNGSSSNWRSRYCTQFVS